MPFSGQPLSLKSRGVIDLIGVRIFLECCTNFIWSKWRGYKSDVSQSSFFSLGVRLQKHFFAKLPTQPPCPLPPKSVMVGLQIVLTSLKQRDTIEIKEQI